MKRSLAVLAVLVPVGLTACAGPEVVVRAAVERDGAAEPVALAELPVRLLPYDRDAIFDSLTAAAEEPEPQIPPDILAQQEAVQQAQQEWQEATDRYNTVLDSLRILAADLEQRQQQGQRATPQYLQAFRRFEALEDEVAQVEQNMETSFEQFTQLQQGALARSDSIRVVRETWAERAFEDFDQIVEARLDQLGREELADTTDPSGTSRFRAGDGQWWAYARYTLPYQELYWNVPVEITGDRTVVVLNRENAEARPVL